jgi:hypothetical protein
LNVVPLDQSYGALMGLLTWRNFTALAALPGAQIDTEVERERAIGESPGQSFERQCPLGHKTAAQFRRGIF